MKRLGYRLLVVAIVLLCAFLSARLKPPTRQTTLAPSTPSSQSPEGQSPESQRAHTESSGKGDPPPVKEEADAPPGRTGSVESSESSVAGTASRTPDNSTVARTPSTEAPSSFVVRNVSIKDLDGNTAFRGDIDLTATIERVDVGRKLSFSNDGSTFQNRERRLPNRPAGYYREWVHPTPGLRGPGPQRLVTGENGEVWYTPDHYRSFRKLR